MNERCTSCIGERKDACDSIRADVAEKLGILAGWSVLGNHGTPIPPARVIDGVGELKAIGCDTDAAQLQRELNPTDIAL